MSVSASSLLLGGRALSASFRNLAISKPLSVPQAKGLPKRPSNPWVMFYASNYPTYKKKNPGLSTGDIMKKIGVDWNNVSADKKSTLTAGYEKEKAKWKKQMDALPRDEKEMALLRMRGRRLDEKIRTAVMELRALKAMMGQPKKGSTSAYIVYLEDRHSKLPDNLSNKDKITQISSEWNNLTNNQKAPFEKKANEFREKHEKAMTLWQRKMEREGKMKVFQSAIARVSALRKEKRELFKVSV